jgi:hypothetical protein
MLNFISDLPLWKIHQIKKKGINFKNSRKFVRVEIIKRCHWVKKHCVLWVVPSTFSVICLARKRIFVSIVVIRSIGNDIVNDACVSLPDIIISGAMRCILKLKSRQSEV